MSSPAQRSLKYLREQGYTAAITEHWNGFARIRQDLFGFVDIVAIRDGETLAVQTTSYSNMAARIKKIAEHENVAVVRKANWRIEVHGWKKNQKTKRWELTVKDVS
jgi:carbonic anhydrase